MVARRITVLLCAGTILFVPVAPVDARTGHGDRAAARSCPANPRPTPTRDLPPELKAYAAELRPIGEGVLWTVRPRRVPVPTEQGTWVMGKVPWFRLEEGPLTVEGRRIDGDRGTFRADLPPVESYPLDLNLHIGPGFIPSSFEFSSPGCWKLTARLGDSKVVLHVRVG